MARTALYHHECCRQHQMQAGHPESPSRLAAIVDRLQDAGLMTALAERTPEPVTDDALRRVHTRAHLEHLRRLAPADGLVALDADTAMSPATLPAARLAAGAAVQAVDAAVDSGQRAFCAVRPPGHHAETSTAMGFCFFNNIAVAAAHALDRYALERVAVLDFDVHHGNGTVDIFLNDPRVLVCSSFQHPFYPGRMTDVRREHIVCSPLAAGSDGYAFRSVVERQWLPALERHRPQLLLVSAGFDAHVDDPLAGLCFENADYHWIGALIRDLADHYTQGRVVATLEGGYDLRALADAVETHLTALAGL